MVLATARFGPRSSDLSGGVGGTADDDGSRRDDGSKSQPTKPPTPSSGRIRGSRMEYITFPIMSGENG
jgi:hypothetical protein